MQDSDGLLLEARDEDNDEDDVNLCVDKSVEKKQCGKVLRRRSKPKVVRTVWFNKDTDSEKHYRELLFLFTPWRDEGRDIDNFRPYEERCRELSEQINAQLEQYSPCRCEVDEALLDMRDWNDEMWDSVAPNAHHTKLMDSIDNCRNVDNNVDTAVENYDLSDELTRFWSTKLSLYSSGWFEDNFS